MRIQPPESAATSRRPIGPGLLVAGLVTIVAGLLAPLLFGSFSEGQLAALAIVEVACLVVVAVGIVLLARRLQASHEALWDLARRDELTGLGNYRALHERLEQEVARHGRRSREFALILLDLDGFKQVNERFGHPEGDRLLAEVGASLLDEVRSEDSVFRQGGDEFAVIAPETNSEEAIDVAARLRTRLRGCGESVEVSAGAGFAIFPGDGSTIEELFGSADRDLLAAKQGGRSV